MKPILLLPALLALAAPAAAQPQINPAAVRVVGSPNVLGWPVTTKIASIDVEPGGMHVNFDRCDAWPPVTPPGWGGPLTYTLWLFMKIGDEWFGAGIIQFWDCASQLNGGPIYLDNQIARNWVYGDAWSSMKGHQPAPGERIAFMVSAGNARLEDDHLIAERSAIVEVAMPTGPGLLPFLAVEGTVPNPPPPVMLPPPPPVVVPPPVVQPPAPSPQPPAPVFDEAALRARIAELKADVDAGRAEAQAFYEHVGVQWKSVMTFLGKYIAPAIAGVIGGWQLGK